MNDQDGSYARLRHTATGALAAVGAIAGTAALAANSRPRPHRHATVADGSTTSGGATKTPTSPAPGKAHTPQPVPQAFLTDAHRLVRDGTITTTEGQVLDSEIQAGRVDTDMLASSGFTPTQIQAVQQALSNTKHALGRTAPPQRGRAARHSRTPKPTIRGRRAARQRRPDQHGGGSGCRSRASGRRPARSSKSEEQ